MSSTPATDEVHIHRQFKDSYIPRRYVVTGGTFAEMKDVVKATPGARFDGTMKSWLVVGQAAIDTLTAHGWSVEVVPTLRYDWKGTMLMWRDNQARYQQDREQMRQDGRTIANVYTHLFDPRWGHDMDYGAPTIYIEIEATADAVACANAQEAKTRAKVEADYGIKDSGDSSYGGWMTIIRVAGRSATDYFVKIFNKAYSAGGKTAQAYRAALEALEDLDDAGRYPKVLVTVRAENDDLVCDVSAKENGDAE